MTSLRRYVVLVAVCLALILVMSPVTAQTTADEEQNRIEKIIHDYLLANPAVMLEVFDRVTRYQKNKESKRVLYNLVRLSEELYDDPDSVAVGNPEADVTIVEFFDYRCSYCKRNHPILGPESVVASRAAIASRKQGYWEFHNAMMLARGKLTEQRVFKLAAEAGLDVKQLQDDIRSPAISQIIQRNYRLAEALGVKGTPGFVIGDSVIPGFLSTENLGRAVLNARESCLSC